jgi:uncharacterized protein YjdB
MNKIGFGVITVLVASLLAPTVNVLADTAPAYGVEYEGHVQNIGWQAPVITTGDETDITNVKEAGTDGQGLRVEAVKITGVNLPAGASITYEAQVQNKGWMAPVTTQGNAAIDSAAEAGTDGQGLRVETFKMTLNGLPGYSIKYQTHVQNIGWQAPVTTPNGTDINSAAISGTVGQGLRMEALKIQIVKSDTNNGYVNNPDFQTDLKVRSGPSLSAAVLGYLYNYEKIAILGTSSDASGNLWDKINYNNNVAYVSNAYIEPYTSPSDNVVAVASNITKQFEVGNSNEIAGNFDGEGLSIGYFQWCIGQGTLQPLLNRMDREYNSEMKSIFASNYTSIHNMILDTSTNQLKWADSINDSNNNIISPWYSEFINLTNNADFKSIEKDSEVYTVNQAMLICNKYNLKTVRGFALAFDICVHVGSINASATKIIANALNENPNITEKNLITIIANAVADSASSNASDIRSRNLAIVNGQGTVHGIMLYLDRDYGLSDNSFR